MTIQDGSGRAIFLGHREQVRIETLEMIKLGKQEDHALELEGANGLGGGGGGGFKGWTKQGPCSRKTLKEKGINLPNSVTKGCSVGELNGGIFGLIRNGVGQSLDKTNHRETRSSGKGHQFFRRANAFLGVSIPSKLALKMPHD